MYIHEYRATCKIKKKPSVSIFVEIFASTFLVIIVFRVDSIQIMKVTSLQWILEGNRWLRPRISKELMNIHLTFQNVRREFLHKRKGKFVNVLFHQVSQGKYYGFFSFLHPSVAMEIPSSSVPQQFSIITHFAFNYRPVTIAREHKYSLIFHLRWYIFNAHDWHCKNSFEPRGRLENISILFALILSARNVGKENFPDSYNL